jgi:DNA-binding MarR family transcriptional regulator
MGADRMRLSKAERRYRLATHDYAQLAAFRRALRQFLHFSEQAAAHAGLTARYYQAMLIIRGCPHDQCINVNDLARELLIRHNSAVGLVDRLTRKGLITRKPSMTDRRKVELRLTGAGRKVLAKLAAMHRNELRRIGPLLRVFFTEIAEP